MKIIIISIIVWLYPIIAGAANHQLTGLPLSSSGWTDFAGMVTAGTYDDARVVFVSSTDGNDGTGAPDTISNVTFDSNGIFQATGIIHPYATVAAGYAQIRDGYPDILLLKRGDTWDERFSVGSIGNWNKSGPTSTQRIIFASYGATGDRPKLNSDLTAPFFYVSNVDNLIVSGLWFYASDWNAVADAHKGFDVGGGSTHILFEDMNLQQTYQSAVQGGYTAINSYIVMRRSVVRDTNAHDGMFYASYGDHIAWEENLFYRPNDDAPTAPAVYGRVFYLSPDGLEPDGTTVNQHKLTNVIIRNNILFYADRGGIDGRSGGTFNNNLLVRASMNAGGYGGSSGSIQSANIYDNVFLEGSPTTGGGSNLLLINMLDTNVYNNIFTDPENITLSTTAIQMKNDSEGLEYAENINIYNNIIYGRKGTDSSRGIQIYGVTDITNVDIYDNDIQMVTGSTDLINLDGGTTFTGLTFSGNHYYTTAAADAWFTPGDSMAGWITASGEIGSSATEITYTAPTRTLKTYNQSLGGDADTDDFMTEALLQSRHNWRLEYTACAANNYIRAGFDKAAVYCGYENARRYAVRALTNE